MKKLIIIIITLIVAGFALPYKKGIGTWIDINLLTLSTKEKQEKKLDLAEALMYRGNLEEYLKCLTDAGDMARKIIFLDGAEIELAEKFEKATREQEQFFVETKNYQGLILAMNENEQMFKFMVKNYQATEDDIKKHQKILDAHLEMIESAAGVEDLIVEARKFRDAGLNIEAYELIKKAKLAVYSKN